MKLPSAVTFSFHYLPRVYNDPETDTKLQNRHSKSSRAAKARKSDQLYQKAANWCHDHHERLNDHRAACSGAVNAATRSSKNLSLTPDLEAVLELAWISAELALLEALFAEAGGVRVYAGNTSIGRRFGDLREGKTVPCERRQHRVVQR